MNRFWGWCTRFHTIQTDTNIRTEYTYQFDVWSEQCSEMGDLVPSVSSDKSDPHRGKGQLLVATAGWKGRALSKEILGLAMFMAESTLTVVLSDSQFDRQLSSSTVHRADVMLFCRSIVPLCGSNL